MVTTEIEENPETQITLRKEQLRQEILRKEKELGSDYLLDSDEVAFSLLYKLDEYKNARTVFCYYGIGTEPNTKRVIETALKDGKTVALPKIRGNGLMEARVIYGLDELEQGTFGIPEPSMYTEILPTEEIDLIIMPGLGFDLYGNRIGRGGGYYDRFLVNTKAVKIGLTREKLVCTPIPVEEHDKKIDVLITEEKVRKF
jgi:5-formyltetrahydrofolate cyclo-ligase